MWRSRRASIVSKTKWFRVYQVSLDAWPSPQPPTILHAFPRRHYAPNEEHHDDRDSTTTLGTTVLLFENLHRFMGSVELIQAVARQAITGKHNRAFIVVLAPVTQIPPELDKLFVCVVHELPDHAQLEEIA